MTPQRSACSGCSRSLPPPAGRLAAFFGAGQPNWVPLLPLVGFAATSVTQVTLRDQRCRGLLWLLTDRFLREIGRDPSLGADSRAEHGQLR